MFKNRKLIFPVLIACFLPVLILISLISVYAVNVPFGDDWTLAGILQNLHQGDVSPSDFWRQHNEHRILFPKVLMVATALVTHWSTVAQIAINILLAIITFLLIGLYLTSKVKDKIVLYSTLFLCSCWFFSPVEWENWLWAWQATWFLSLLIVVSTLLLANRVKSDGWSKMYFISLLLAVSATFSLGDGMVVWVAGIVILVLKRSQKKLLTGWMTVAIVSIALYYLGYQKPTSSPSIAESLHQPIEVIRYYLALFGRPITDNLDAAIMFGTLLLAMIIPLAYYAVQKKKYLIDSLPLTGIVIFILISAGLTSVSRVGFGLGQSLSSRYTALSLLLIVMILMAIALAIDKIADKKLLRLVVITLVVMNAPLLFASYSNGIKGMHDRSDYMREVKSCLNQPKLSDACAQEAFPGNGDIIRKGLSVAKTYRLTTLTY